MTRVQKLRILETEMLGVQKAITQSTDLSERFYLMTNMVALETRYHELTGRYYNTRRKKK